MYLSLSCIQLPVELHLTRILKYFPLRRISRYCRPQRSLARGGVAGKESAGEGDGGHDDSRQPDPSLGCSLGGSELLPAGKEDDVRGWIESVPAYYSGLS